MVIYLYGVPALLMKCHIDVDLVKIEQKDETCKGAKSYGTKIVVFILGGQNRNLLKDRGLKVHFSRDFFGPFVPNVSHLL